MEKQRIRIYHSSSVKFLYKCYLRVIKLNVNARFSDLGVCNFAGSTSQSANNSLRCQLRVAVTAQVPFCPDNKGMDAN
jgi:hypothetical protein